jgi:hypothetical protein
MYVRPMLMFRCFVSAALGQWRWKGGSMSPMDPLGFRKGAKIGGRPGANCGQHERLAPVMFGEVTKLAENHNIIVVTASSCNLSRYLRSHHRDAETGGAQLWIVDPGPKFPSDATALPFVSGFGLLQ